MAVETLESIIRQQRPGYAKAWDGWEARLKPKSFKPQGHRGMYGDLAGYVKKVDSAAYDKAMAALDALNKPKDTPAELPTVDTPAVETQVSEAEGAIRRRRGRSSTILTGMNGDGASAPMVKRKSLLGSFSANG